MKTRSLLGALFVGGLAAASAQAAVVLPSGATGYRFDGVAAFTASSQPTIITAPTSVGGTDVTGALVGVGGGPITATAFGNILTITDADNSSNTVLATSGAGELTFSFTGAVLTPTSFSVEPTLTNSTMVTYTVNSDVNGANAVLKMYDRPANSLNTESYVGQSLATAAPGGADALASGGDSPWLTATNLRDATARITISFNRLDSASAFTSYTIRFQGLNGGAFDVTQASDPALQNSVGTKLKADQLGLLTGTVTSSEQGGTILLLPDGTPGSTLGAGANGNFTVNSPSDLLAEGSVQAVIRAVPEPASAGLLALGGLMLLARRPGKRELA